MQKQKGIVEIILVLLLIAALGAAGYFYLQWQKTTKPSLQPPAKWFIDAEETLKDRITSTPTSDPTADWETVSHNKFRIRYPRDKYQASATTEGIVLRLIGSALNNYAGSPSFVVVNDYNGGSRRRWYMNYYSYSQSDVGKSVFFTEKNLGNVDVLFVAAPGNTDIRDILVAQGNTLIDVLIQVADVDLDLLEKIISTIEFLD